MYKAVNNGDFSNPGFTFADVSGSGNNIIYAGSKYLMDKEGHYVDESGNIVDEAHKVENEDGFQIISGINSDNIYKLYNNGTLYGKGLKGKYLNTSQSEMKKIDPAVWRTLNVPAEIGSYKQVIPGAGCYFVIDNNDELWALGNNEYNKFGLTEDQQIEFTGRDPIKLNVGGKKVFKVYCCTSNTYVVTLDNGVYELYGAGKNDNGQLGIGNTNYVNCFTKCIGINNPQDLLSVESITNTNVANLFVVKDETNAQNLKVYFAGLDDCNNVTLGWNQYYTEITRIYDGIHGNDIDQNIKQIKFVYRYITILTKDGKIIIPRSGGGFATTVNNNLTFQEVKPETWGCTSTDTYTVDAMYGSHIYWITIFEITKNGEKNYFIFSRDYNFLGLEGSVKDTTYNFTNDIPTELKNEGIKNIYVVGGACYLLGNTSGKLWGAGHLDCLGLGSDVVTQKEGFVCLQDETENLNYSLPKIKNIYYYTDSSVINGMDHPFFVGNDDKIYLTGNSTLMFRNDILEKNWVEIAKDVKQFNCIKNAGLAYIDKNNDVWIVGDYSTRMGIDEEDDRAINNFTLLKNLVDSTSKAFIENNVKDMYFSTGASYLLTLDKKLYVSGRTLTPSWNGNNKIGVSATNADSTINNRTKSLFKIIR